jgi:cysteine synthase
LKELLPNITVVGVDPDWSMLAVPEELNVKGTFLKKTEGIGKDF